MTNPIITPEEEITQQIIEIHGPFIDPFEANSLFIITANILKRSTQIVDVVMQANIQVLDELDDNPKEGFRVPMCLLKNIGCELFNCKDSVSPDIAHETTLTILKKLRKFSWEAKAVLILAAFAKEFGDLLQLDQAHTNDQLTKSLAILKGSIIRQTRRDAVLQLNNLIKETLEVMKIIFKPIQPSVYIPRLSIAELLKPINVYWIIITVIACANQVTLITNDEDKLQDLSFYRKKVSEYKAYILSKLGVDVPKPIGPPPEVVPIDREYYELLRVFSKVRTEVVDFLKRLLSARDSDYRVQLIKYSDNNYTTVDIDVLNKKKKVIFVVSWLGRNEILEDDLAILRRIQLEKIKKDYFEDQQYAIVWVPIADENWTGQYKLTKREDFEFFLRSKNVLWYTVNNFVLRKESLKFLKEEWHFETSPIAVVMDLTGERIIEYTYDAFYTMRIWGLDAFPFDKEAKERKFREISWISTIFKDFFYQYWSLKNWVEDGKYIILHGGIDRQWAKEIETKVKLISRETNISIELFDVNQERVKDLFWNGVSMLYAEAEYAKQQLKRLSSYKEEQGWFVLNKGSTAVVVGSRKTFFKVVDEIYNWKEYISQRTFEIAFKEYHEKIFSAIIIPPPPPHPTDIKWTVINGCLIAEIPITADGKFSKQTVNCLKCSKIMEMISVNYKCCHTSKASLSDSYYYAN